MSNHGRNPYRKKLSNSITLIAAAVTLVLVALTHVLFKIPYNVTKTYVESRMDRVERKTDELLKPYRDITNRHIDRFNRDDSSDFDSGTDYSYIYANRSKDHVTDLVTKTACPHSFHVLLLITSNLLNFERRRSIRATWGEDPVSDVRKWKTYFLIGRLHDNKKLYHLSKEIKRHGDIILANTMEDFYNLGPKLQMAFEWSYKYCDFKYVVKGDDDVFVNIPRLFAFVNSHDIPKHSLYAGNVHYAAVVFRDGRYGMSKGDYWKNKYPRYCSGGGFVLTRDVVEKFFNALNSVSVIKIDDAYIGELALKVGVDVYHDDDFQMFQDLKRCFFRKSTIIHHPVKRSDCMEVLYERTVESIIEMRTPEASRLFQKPRVNQI